MSSEELKSIMEDLDVDNSGKLEFNEFVILSARFRKVKTLFFFLCYYLYRFLGEEDEECLKSELKEAFRIYDKEGNGFITTSTLKEILQELDPKLSEDELKGIIEEVDEDESGTVDFDEFMDMMTG